jgi:hypothetical protein
MEPMKAKLTNDRRRRHWLVLGRIAEKIPNMKLKGKKDE